MCCVSYALCLCCANAGGAPSLKDLVQHVIPSTAAKWDRVGLSLDVKPAILDAVQRDHQKADDCAKAMFWSWLQASNGTGDQARTWENVLTAVERGCGSEVRKEVEAKLQAGDSRSSAAFTTGCQTKVIIGLQE